MVNKEETSEFGGLVYCTECYAVVGETDECLCLVDAIGCGREEERGGCCGGGCGG